jgi:hypothetical protein
VSKTQLDVKVSFVALDCEELPKKDGQTMYADDVEVEVRDVVEAAVTDWYRRRGHALVSFEPMVS